MKTGIITVLLIVLLTINLANAASFSKDPITQDLPLGNTISYILTLNPDGDDSIDTLLLNPNYNVDVRIYNDDIDSEWIPGGEVDSPFDFFNSGVNGQNFTLEIRTNDDAVVGDKYKVRILYGEDYYEIEAAVTTIGNITPELSTGILMSAGLIGLVGLTRYRRKE